MNYTTKPPVIAGATAPVLRPEFFNLPRKGHDPYFGLCRSEYYRMEVEGKISLLRLRRPGAMLGKVLVPYDSISAHLRELHADQINAAAKSAN